MPETPLTVALLARLLQAKDPSVVLVPAALLRRVIRHDRGFLAMSLHVPHNKAYLVKRDTLLRLATKEELATAPGDLAPQVTLLVAPSDEHVEKTPRDAILLEYWRLLFHARIHAVLEERWEKGELTLQAVERWIAEVGDTEFREATAVLEFEHMLLPPLDRRNAFIELVAVYLELYHFAGTLIPSYFPSLRDRAAALADSLGRETGALALLAATRPDGAPDPSPPAETASEEPVAYFKKLVQDAREESAAGNRVRAAILMTRAKRVAPAAFERPTEEGALREIDTLVARLVHVTGQEGTDLTDRWKRVLSILLDKADQQDHWPPEARLLFDLQSACDDGERDVYRVSALRWLVKREAKEALPDQRDMQLLRHLTRATTRLPSVRLSVEDRNELDELLRGAVRDVDGRLRARLRPIIERAFTDSGLTPKNLPEAAVLGKLTDELLDRTMVRWFLTYGDIRDALSANQLKLPDVLGARDLASRGTMVQIDRRLAASLKGIYRPGELYRHGLQRASSLLAATGAGRALVWFLLLPIGGAIGLRVGFEHLRDVIEKGVEPAPATGLVPGIELGVLAAVLFLLINNKHARAFASSVLLHLSFAVRALVVDIPLLLVRLRPVRRLLANELFMAFVRYVLRPGLLTGAIYLGFFLAHHQLDVPVTALVFLSSALALNSHPWRSLEEGLEESLLRSWRFIRLDFVPGFFRLIMRFFKRLSEMLEAMVFAVDEMLRYRTGESRGMLIAKAILAPLWAPVAWALRFTFDVVLEPRLNPVKYVSVVMIVDKISIPMTSRLLAFWTHFFEPLGAFPAKMLALAMLWNVPAAIGFLIWEFKENWRLYRANRSPVIEPQPLSLQGETLPRLLKGGGHGHGGSKLPSLYARLRRAERHAHRTGNWTESRKQRAQLEEFRDQVKGFVERSFLRLLAASKGWENLPVGVSDVVLGLNEVAIHFESRSHPGKRVVIVLEAEEGWLVASTPEPGWLAELGRRQFHVFKSALVGLYAMAGVELVREQIQAHLADFPSLGLTFSVIAEGLKVWPRDRFEAAAIYDLLGSGPIRPQPIFTPTVLALPPLEANRLVFGHAGLSWDAWVQAWEDEEADRELRLVAEIPLPIRGLKTGVLRASSARTQAVEEVP